MYNIELFCNLLENCRISKELITQLITKVPKNIVDDYSAETLYEKCIDVINQNITETISNCTNDCGKCYKYNNCTYKNPFRAVSNESANELSLTNFIGYKTEKFTNCITGINSNIFSDMPYTNYNETFVTMPKTAILQALLYHFFIKDNLGMIRDISLKMVSDILGVSTCCVKRNNDLLQACNLIHVVPLGKNRYNIAICKTVPLYETKKNGGKGYITMTKEQFKHILDLSKQKLDKDITCVNMIKSELRLLLNADVASNDDQKIGKISMHRYNSIFPNYLQKSVKNKELLLNNSLFEYKKVDNNVILFDISNYKKKETLISDLKFSIKSDLIDFIEKHDIMQVDIDSSINIAETPKIGNNHNPAYNELKELVSNSKENSGDKKKKFVQQPFNEILSDLIDLSIEYGRKTIKDVLLRIKHRYIDMESLQIENWGAFVRQQVRLHVTLYGSMFSIAV